MADLGRAESPHGEQTSHEPAKSSTQPIATLKHIWLSDMLSSGLRQVSKMSKSVRDRLKINCNEIIDLPSNSRAVRFASDLNSLDGYQSDSAIIDEFALARHSMRFYEH